MTDSKKPDSKKAGILNFFTNIFDKSKKDEAAASVDKGKKPVITAGKQADSAMKAKPIAQQITKKDENLVKPKSTVPPSPPPKPAEVQKKKRDFFEKFSLKN